MAAVNDFVTIVADRDLKEKWIGARNALVNAMASIEAQYQELQQYVPTVTSAPSSSLKTTIIRQYTRIVDFRSATLADTEYMNLHNWTPE